MKFAPAVIAFAIVIAQPVLGWEAIPRYFNYSTGAAVGLGLLDAGILIVGLFWTFVWCRA